jgi:hypothetical protein
MTDFQQTLQRFLASKSSIFCVQGIKKFYDKQCFFVSDSKKFCIDYLIYKKPFPENKIPVLIYNYDSTLNDIIIQEWIAQSRKIIMYSSFISEHIMMSLLSFTTNIISYIHHPRYPITTSYHEKYELIDDVYVFLKGFLLMANTHNNRTVVFLKTPHWCDEMHKKFKDTYSTISLHGRNLKSQFNPKEFANTSLIFTTNLHHKRQPLSNVRWILDFSNDSKIQMDERKALASDQMPCDIHYFCSMDSLSVYPSMYPFDWKPLILHGILADNLDCIKKWTSSWGVDMELLRSYKILTETNEYYGIIRRYPNILSKLSSGCPFLIEHYAQIIHLYHMTQCSMPEIMILLTTMSLSVIDIIKRYGNDSFFSVPPLKGVSSLSVLNIWKMILSELSMYKDYHLMQILEVIVSVIMKDSKTSFHIHNTTWLRFMERWKYLCSLVGIFTFHNNKTMVFHKIVRGIFKKHFTGHLWNIDNDDTFISDNFIVNHLLHSRQGIWHRLSYPYNEKLFDYMWKLSDYSDWTSDIDIYKRRWFKRRDKTNRIVLEFDRGLDITMPLPLTLHKHIIDLKENIESRYSNMQSIREDKQNNRLLFTETVVRQIDEDVANRPYMAKYIETMRDFYKILDKPEESFTQRVEYFNYLDTEYKKGNKMLMTNYEDYIRPEG